MLNPNSINLNFYQSAKEDNELLNEAGAFYLQAIENADGVPFQLIFGQEIGEGYYPNNGGGMKDLLGISPGDLTEKTFYDLVEEIIPLTPDIPSNLYVARELFKEGHLKSYKADLRIKTPQGKGKWIRESLLPLKDKLNNNKVIGAFGIFYDITHLKNNYSSHHDSEDSQKLKASFLRNVSHEIRTPLHAIVGISSLIGDPGQPPEQLEEFKDILVKSSDHLLEVITNIIEMSKIEAGLINVCNEPINVTYLLNDIFNQFIKSAKSKSINLKLELPESEELIILKTDKIKLTQILQNIIGNALKFSQGGEVVFGIEKLDNNAVFFVSDDGPGIHDDHQEKIFDSFYQVENSITHHDGGIGLGLSISKAYIEILGGRISLSSKPGKGSCFRFSLPI